MDATPAPDATPPDAAVAWSVETFCTARAARWCTGLATCGCRFDIRPYDAAGCEAAQAADCAAQFAQISAAIDAGQLGFSAGDVTACLEGVAAVASACSYPTGYDADLDACQRVIVATAALGETCAIEGGGPCADGAGLCIPGENGGNGVCTALPTAAQPCPQGACAIGLVCKQGESAVCAPPGAAAATCQDDRECGAGLGCLPDGHCGAPGAIGATCFDRKDCAPGLACPAGTCAAGTPIGEECRGPDACGATRGCGRAPETRTCGAPAAAGEACMDGTCAAGLGCAQATMTCQPLPTVGQPCLDGAGCAAGLTCGFADSTCIALPGAGQACAEGVRRCAAGLGCRDTDQTCQPASVATSGQPCLADGVDYLCATGLGCDFAPGGSVCIPIGGAGDACTNDRVCGPGTYCEFSVLQCTAKVANGGACEDGNECLAGAECAPQPSGFTCTALPAAGEPCFEGCAGGLACKGAGGECTAELCTLP